jgi:hypothetical protein
MVFDELRQWFVMSIDNDFYEFREWFSMIVDHGVLMICAYGFGLCLTLVFEDF